MKGLEKLYIYACLGVVLWIVITIMLVYTKNYFFDRLIKLTKEQRKLEKERRDGNKPNNSNSYYVNCKNLFNQQMKNGKLKRERLLELKDLIDLCLGDKVRNYNNYTFKNDCHEIYVKLKSECLNQLDYERITKFLLDNKY